MTERLLYGILVGMILNLENSKLFLVKCSDWKIALTSTDHEEACTEAISHMLKIKGRHLKISCVMLSTDVSSLLEYMDEDESTVFHPTSKILANAGYHKIAKDLKGVFGT